MEAAIANESDAIVSFNEVSVRYPGANVVAIKNLSLRVAPGELVALIGPSGAGKSTILSLAAGLAIPTGGQVKVLSTDSAELAKRGNRHRRRRIGIISQDFALVGPLSVASNVAAGRLGQWSWLRAVRSLFRPGPMKEIVSALEAVGIGEKLWERADNLSGGQQQRTAIARALFQQPELLLADEPVSALDPSRSDAVMKVLAEMAIGTGGAMIVSMHDAPLALRHCDRIVAMRDGQLFFDLPASEVNDELLDELYLLDEPSTV